MKTATVYFTGFYTTEIEIPDDWTPTPENMEALKADAWEAADFRDGSASWALGSGETSNAVFDIPE